MPDLTILGDSPTTEDGLGFDSYVDILLDAIRNFDAASSLTIGIHGSWGSGKTSLMRMLEKRFDDDNAVKTVWFNAWAQGQEEPIGLALLYRVLTELEKEEGSKEKIGTVLENIGKLLVDAGLRRVTGITLEEAQKLFKGSIEIRSTLRDNFEAALAEGLGDKRFVVFIDDLDRCLPEKTIEILEVIKLFLDASRCVFVIGVAREMIERGIAMRYKIEGRSPISGKDYIEKIIQVPFTLPPIREEEMARFIESLGIAGQEKGYAAIVARGTECNPRRVKMFLNTLRIRQEIAERTGGGIKPELSAKLFVIEYTFPDFYKDLVKYREEDFLCTLERLANEKDEANEGLRERLESSETLQKYYKNEDLKSVLKDEPRFCEKDIEPYIYLSGKPPEEVLVFDESILDELLSLDRVKREHALSTIKKVPEAVEIIITRLKDKDEIVHSKAVEALGIIGDAKAVEALIEVLADRYENEGVRWEAAKALGNISEAVEPLIGLLKKTEEAKIRSYAAKALGNIRDRKAVEPLITALKDENDRVRVRAVEALGDIGDRRAIKPLEEALGDEYESVRVSAREALVKIEAK